MSRHEWASAVVPSRMARTALRLLILTLVFGALVVGVWGLVGGRLAFLGPERVARDFALVLYPTLAVATAAATVLLVAFRWRDERGTALVALALGAWLGEGVLLGVFGSLIANELTPSYAPELWLIATGYGLQPAAAAVAALAVAALGHRSSGGRKVS